MTHEPRLRKTKMDYRASWLEDELIHFLPRIEKLTSQAVFQSTGQHILYELDYQQRRRGQKPTASASGSFNIAIFLRAASPTYDLLKHLVLRIPYPDRQCAHDVYEQEAATLSYLGQNTTIPVPTLINHDFDEVMKLPYIIMTQVQGRHLGSFAKGWETFPLKLRQHLFRQIGGIINQLLRLSFDYAGSLIRNKRKEGRRVVLATGRKEGPHPLPWKAQLLMAAATWMKSFNPTRPLNRLKITIKRVYAYIGRSFKTNHI